MDRGVEMPLPQWCTDFHVRTMALLLWKVSRGVQSSPMKKPGRQRAAQSVDSSSPDPVLNIVIN